MSSSIQSPYLRYESPSATHSESTPQAAAWRRFATEIGLLLTGLLLVLSLLALLSFDQRDLAWTTTGQSGAMGNVHNALSRPGAYFADVAYFVSGYSFWWCWLTALFAWGRKLRRWLRRNAAHMASHSDSLHNAFDPSWRSSVWVRYSGLILLVLASCALEFLYIQRWDASLPGDAGGLIGYAVVHWAAPWAGLTAFTLMAIVLWVWGLSWALQFSWLGLAEGMGYGVDRVWTYLQQRQASASDAAAGQLAVRERQNSVHWSGEHAGAGEVQAHLPVMDSSEPTLSQTHLNELSDAGPIAGSVEPRWGPETSSDSFAEHAAASVGPVVADSRPTLTQSDGHTQALQAGGSESTALPLDFGLDAHAPSIDVVQTSSPAPATGVGSNTHLMEAALAVAATSASASVLVPAAPPPPPALVPAPDSASLAEPMVSLGSASVLPADTHSLPLPVELPVLTAAQSTPARVIEAAVAAVPQSTRAVRERQHGLFADLSDSHLPPIDLLDPVTQRPATVSADTLEMTSRLIEKKLKDFGVEVRVVAAAPGPVVTRYEIEPATGVKGSQIVNLAKDLARSLSLMSIRVIETIPGKNCMALELPNNKRQAIKLSEILGSQVYHEAKSLLTIGLGKDIVGNPVVHDLAKMPHVLVAGTTGSGKSVGINAMILSLLYKAEARDVRLLMIDPKMLEMSVYQDIPHLLAPVVTDMKQAAQGLNWCVGEMERRYKLMSKLGVRNLAGYNHKIDEAATKGQSIGNPFSLTPESPEPLDRLPHIVVIIDELADLMMVVGKKIEELIARLAQKARAAGIHLILATQRPSVDVITGLIKANIPSRIAFQVSSKIDSRTILDQMGAESLLGMGDMLFMASGSGFPVRVHGAFVSDDEVHRVVSFLKSKGEPDYVEGLLEGETADSEWALDGLGGAGAEGEKDPMYDQAVQVVLNDRKASISYVQRKLKIGYNRSARLLEDMEKAGIVSPLTSSGQREILVPNRSGDGS